MRWGLPFNIGIHRYIVRMRVQRTDAALWVVRMNKMQPARVEKIGSDENARTCRLVSMHVRLQVARL